MSKILAIDFGLKRCGIAITDDLQMIASPLCVIASQELDAYINGQVATGSISEIVIGLPLHTSGEAMGITQNVRLLSEHLVKLYPTIKIALHDERFTSKMASAALFASGMKKKKREQKGNVDMTSAAIILQGYLRAKESTR